uniref:WD_REPEATS_REGION domain-containing protein n=1 Tax=Mesocestoides corti TaxID=53468 RepID=A0A5K3FEL1_MESCO
MGTKIVSRLFAPVPMEMQSALAAGIVLYVSGRSTEDIGWMKDLQNLYACHRKCTTTLNCAFKRFSLTCDKDA